MHIEIAGIHFALNCRDADILPDAGPCYPPFLSPCVGLPETIRVDLDLRPRGVVNLAAEVRYLLEDRKLSLGVCAVPVIMHSRRPEGVENPYAASKRRQREERFAWYESDEMPSK